MSKLELKTELLTHLERILRSYDFALVRRMDWFVKKGASSLIYRLDFYGGYAKDRGYRVSPSLAIRLNEIEEIFHKVSRFESKYQKDTPTIWVTIADLTNGHEEYDYALDVANDVEPLVQQLFVVFRDIALPFLEENGAAHAINKLLNSNPEKDNSIFCIPEDRYFKGLIVAKLSDDDRYSQIAHVYRKKLEQFLPDRLSDFDRLLDILEEI